MRIVAFLDRAGLRGARQTRLFVAAIALALCVAQGCAHSFRANTPPADIAGLNAGSRGASYVLGPGDVIFVKFGHNEYLNEELSVRPDGRIALRLVGDIDAAGLTPSELAGAVTKAYAGKMMSSDNSYVLAVRDLLAIKFFYHDYLNEEVVIRPDGKISLQLVGDLPAAGMTPSELAEEIRLSYSGVLESPEAVVIVKNYSTPEATIIVRESGNRVFVGGEVARPGMFPLHGATRALDAILTAGGALGTAELETVLLLRNEGKGKPAVYSLNLETVIRGKSPDLILRPNDVLYIPRTAIAEANRFVEQYLTRMIPTQFQANFDAIYDLRR